MDHEREHVARVGQLLQAPQLGPRQRLEPRHEQRGVRGPEGEARAGRRRGGRDPPGHQPPEIVLPTILVGEQIGNRGSALLFVVGRRVHVPARLVSLPLLDHLRPADVVLVEQSRDPAGGEQRLALHIERDVEAADLRSRNHVEHGEREPVERPAIGVEAPGWLQEREDRARVGEVDVRHEPVAAVALDRPAPRPQLPGEFAEEPRLRARIRHHDPRPLEQVAVAREELQGVIQHGLEPLDEGDLKGHDASLSDGRTGPIPADGGDRTVEPDFPDGRSGGNGRPRWNEAPGRFLRRG